MNDWMNDGLNESNEWTHVQVSQGIKPALVE